MTRKVNGAASVLTLPIAVDDLLPTGRDFQIEATAEQRQALAAAYGLVRVDSMSARGRVERRGKVFRVTGSVTAEVVQSCVVTLDPVVQAIDEEILVEFTSNDRVPAADTANVDPEAQDPPDFLEDGLVDVGALVEEHMVLGLEPYPRRDDAAIPSAYQPQGEKRQSPFSALADLQDSTDKQRNQLRSED